MASNYNVECEEETGISGTSAYPTINIASGATNLPPNATFGGASHIRDLRRRLRYDHHHVQFGDDRGVRHHLCPWPARPRPVNPRMPRSNSRARQAHSPAATLTPVTSATLDINYVNPTTPTCIDPATGGSTTTFFEGTANSSYTVECEDQTGVTGVAAYPTQIAETGSLSWGGSTATFGTEAGRRAVPRNGATTTTSGTGTTEFYILECALKTLLSQRTPGPTSHVPGHQQCRSEQRQRDQRSQLGQPDRQRARRTRRPASTPPRAEAPPPSPKGPMPPTASNARNRAASPE